MPNYSVQFTFNFIHKLQYGHASTLLLKFYKNKIQQAEGEVMCLKINLI